MKSYTDLEQSKTLEKILPIESADLYYDIDFDKEYHIKMPTNGYFGNKRFFVQFPEAVPCWSLAALINALPSGKCLIQDKVDLGYKGICNIVDTDYHDNPVDAFYEMILKLHELKEL